MNVSLNSNIQLGKCDINRICKRFQGWCCDQAEGIAPCDDNCKFYQGDYYVRKGASQ